MSKKHKKKEVIQPLPWIYVKSDKCRNRHADYNCTKCGYCGRVFKDGVLIDDD